MFRFLLNIRKEHHSVSRNAEICHQRCPTVKLINEVVVFFIHVLLIMGCFSMIDDISSYHMFFIVYLHSIISEYHILSLTWLVEWGEKPSFWENFVLPCIITKTIFYTYLLSTYITSIINIMYNIYLINSVILTFTSTAHS